MVRVYVAKPKPKPRVDIDSYTEECSLGVEAIEIKRRKGSGSPIAGQRCPVWPKSTDVRGFNTEQENLEQTHESQC